LLKRCCAPADAPDTAVGSLGKGQPVHYFIRVDIHQPEGMPIERFLEICHRGAEATQAARERGSLQGWKVVGQRTVLCIADFPDHDALDRALSDLPTVEELGGSVRVEAWPLRPYDHFADGLQDAVTGA
jgi:muconolactone delta-isomerase